MSSTTTPALQCAGCGAELERGAALLCRPLAGRDTAPYLIHRPGVSNCLWRAGYASETSICELDPAAARELDATAGGARSHAVQFAKRAIES